MSNNTDIDQIMADLENERRNAVKTPVAPAPSPAGNEVVLSLAHRKELTQILQDAESAALAGARESGLMHLVRHAEIQADRANFYRRHSQYADAAQHDLLETRLLSAERAYSARYGVRIDR